MNNLIIVIEDNDDDVLIIERSLTKGKIMNKIERFVNGKEALNFFTDNSSQAVELILLDLNMEVMNGFEFLKKRQALDRLKKIPVVVLTSSNRDFDIKLAYELGANAYVEKPMDPKEFVKVILSIEEFWLLIAKKASND